MHISGYRGNANEHNDRLQNEREKTYGSKTDNNTTQNEHHTFTKHSTAHSSNASQAIVNDQLTLPTGKETGEENAGSYGRLMKNTNDIFATIMNSINIQQKLYSSIGTQQILALFLHSNMKSGGNYGRKVPDSTESKGSSCEGGQQGRQDGGSQRGGGSEGQGDGGGGGTAASGNGGTSGGGGGDDREDNASSASRGDEEEEEDREEEEEEEKSPFKDSVQAIKFNNELIPPEQWCLLPLLPAPPISHGLQGPRLSPIVPRKCLPSKKLPAKGIRRDDLRPVQQPFPSRKSTSASVSQLPCSASGQEPSPLSSSSADSDSAIVVNEYRPPRYHSSSSEEAAAVPCPDTHPHVANGLIHFPALAGSNAHVEDGQLQASASNKECPYPRSLESDEKSHHSKDSHSHEGSVLACSHHAGGNEHDDETSKDDKRLPNPSSNAEKSDHVSD